MSKTKDLIDAYDGGKNYPNQKFVPRQKPLPIPPKKHDEDPEDDGFDGEFFEDDELLDMAIMDEYCGS